MAEVEPYGDDNDDLIAKLGAWEKDADELRAKMAAKREVDPNSGCWLWTGFLNQDGYAMHYVRAGFTRQASRIAWMLERGRIPQGLHVCHKCDTPACVNPEHLFLGTAKENMEDRSRKGRNASHVGGLNGRARIKEADVSSIRADPRPYLVIAAEYGVSDEAIGMVKRRITWNHIA